MISIDEKEAELRTLEDLHATVEAELQRLRGEISDTPPHLMQRRQGKRDGYRVIAGMLRKRIAYRKRTLRGLKERIG